MCSRDKVLLPKNPRFACALVNPHFRLNIWTYDLIQMRRSCHPEKRLLSKCSLQQVICGKATLFFFVPMKVH